MMALGCPQSHNQADCSQRGGPDVRADLFRVENAEIKAMLYPGPGESYAPGAFTRLLAAINAEDRFSHWYQQKGHRVSFDSDKLNVEIDTRSLEIMADIAAFPNYGQAMDEICGIVDAAADILGDDVDFILPTRFLLWGVWPLEPDLEERDIGTILKEKTLQLTDGHFALLPGQVDSAAIELVGREGEMRWIVKIAPFLPEPDHLYLSADLRLTPPDKPPDTHSHLVRSGMEQTYEFLMKKAVPFAGSFMP